ncbi:hypothetical protein GY45DRAFT_252338 [Cubamyces sp. BRFM 1775]|nr:hypothetical protein GY45DRAFT_252338 [Cubamyces sp. BRFM 1775]
MLFGGGACVWAGASDIAFRTRAQIAASRGTSARRGDDAMHCSWRPSAHGPRPTGLPCELRTAAYAYNAQSYPARRAIFRCIWDSRSVFSASQPRHSATYSPSNDAPGSRFPAYQVVASSVASAETTVIVTNPNTPRLATGTWLGRQDGHGGDGDGGKLVCDRISPASDPTLNLQGCRDVPDGPVPRPCRAIWFLDSVGVGRGTNA